MLQGNARKAAFLLSILPLKTFYRIVLQPTSFLQILETYRVWEDTYKTKGR